MFSRSTQHVGGMIGAGLYGLAVGVVFSVVFAMIRHHLPGTDWRRAGRLAAAGFVALFLVPFLKYPANPPSVGDPGTVTRRTVLYVLLVSWSVVTTWAAWRLHRQLATRGVADYVRSTVAAAYLVTSVGLAYLIFPPYTDAVAPPANLIWHFRLASAAGQLGYWAVLGVVFGILCTRAALRQAEPINA
jgi:predicted cobalt transporter CbtA